MNDIVVVFNSRVGATGTNRNDLTYNFDWSQLKDTHYTINFSLLMETGTWNGNKIPMLFTHFGNTPLVFKTGDTTVAANTEFMGTLKSEILQTSAPGLATYLYAAESDNPGIHLNGRPTQTNPRITFRDATLALLTDGAGAEIGHYVLTIHLTEQHINTKEHFDRYH